MDELWNGTDQLKFRRGGKTLISIGFNDGKFNVLVIFGKSEREKFDLQRNEFSEYICNYYDNSKNYHDGKWMFIDISDETYLDDTYKLLQIKKKPNRKEDLSKAYVGYCGNRCDHCLLYIKNNETEKGNLEFHEKDWKIYHTEDEKRADYSGYTCAGCFSNNNQCPEKNCLAEKGLKSCVECDFLDCNKNSHDFDAGKCNLGISADDVTRAVIPYCANERLKLLRRISSEHKHK
jgi:hypothetical protein